MSRKLFDSELKIMEILWEEGDTSAKELAGKLAEQVGWSKTTTYTVIKKCVEKGAVRRRDPGFLCQAAISRSEAQEYETEELVQRMYGGRADQLVASLLGNKKLPREQVEALKRMVEEWK